MHRKWSVTKIGIVGGNAPTPILAQFYCFAVTVFLVFCFLSIFFSFCPSVFLFLPSQSRLHMRTSFCSSVVAHPLLSLIAYLLG